ncbi:organoarsenical effux MFS transporter ArsJ [Phaeobacter gallaeciensis]|uniref:organoarsenical effux MFS transporter ArsJ n=1 Tax=Phaeobacter gallaeciensis TaxID=60890 RepID=UPI00237FC911|nr:organoarsenical effux MFS transporter ArsJ [Phaeobacter gallaeciensis]MDE4303022.1 organoarsenical effux MFS transporter ArsJ [Phaeobacter gallaeciensis]MDE4307414.1 organoarsenical effux MFS transporter ArsJ [Phaeobacter gallaeciensis]MDE4311872.1 organoarsenical effux MFS transporter ArsJ [Phaeobacter gallaeciensis]MDE4316623.1 organoarsenical effux MFS transporter ArsJ [Phaeobacter gallaeciensis]MDE4320806.1 organoarsenical effux MFS transporter ArsJ [Phaeobacter gallaeciensis]
MNHRPEGLSAYIAVTAAYWAFMLTDGALRMLVLLHFHTLGFSPVQLAYLFVLYEIAGMVTNLSAGWIAARFGLAATLYAGLALQIVALGALTQLDPDWAIGASVVFVMCVQGISGVAKDLAKMSSKSAVKLLAPSANGGLFRWVAVLTGSKNAVKGLGFLLGAALLATLGFSWSIIAMAVVLALVFAAIVTLMPPGLPTGRKGAKFSEVFSKSANVNWLSAARVFLFGARDVWFVVGIPIYFYAVLSDGSEAGNRAAFFMIGTFMAVWIILYGAVQAAAPWLLGAAKRPEGALIRAARGWALALFTVPAALTLAVWMSPAPQPWLTAVLVLGLLAFGALFAVNSSLHSYLILAFTKAERVTMDVGFYYMANAGGRLAGTLLSGLTYQAGGLALVLGTAALMVALSACAAGKLHVEGAEVTP